MEQEEPESFQKPKTEETPEEVDMSLTKIEEYFNSFPPGYKFDPSDDELMIKYLQPKINALVLPPNLMHEVNIYKYNPDYLSNEYIPQGKKIWYFFTSRDRKYRNGKRPNRKAGDGYWKATGADKIIKQNGLEVGFRKALVFYKGKPPKGVKTPWIMHEFRVAGPSQVRKRNNTSNEDTSMRLDDYVLCRIYKKEDGPGKNRSRGQHEAEDDGEGEEEMCEIREKEAFNSPPLSNDNVNMYSTKMVNTRSSVRSFPNMNPFVAPMKNFPIIPDHHLCYDTTEFNHHYLHGNAPPSAVNNNGYYADQSPYYLEQNIMCFDNEDESFVPSLVGWFDQPIPLTFTQDMMNMDDTNPPSPSQLYPYQDAEHDTSGNN